MSDLGSALLQDLNSGKFANTPLLNLIETYIRYYASGSSHTARAKRLDLHHFLDFLKSYRSVSKIEKLKSRDWDFSAVQRFVDHSLERGEAPATVARRLATIKHMGRTFAEKVPGFINPAKEIKAPKVKLAKPKSLKAGEVRAIKTKASARISEKSNFIRLRNAVLFNFLIDTGLRADEVRNLRLAQLDEKLEWITNVRTKGRRYRNVYITSEMRPELKKYLGERARELKKYYAKLTATQDKNHPLFISSYGCAPGKPETFLMGAKTIWRAIHELSASKELHPHLLRHSYAMDLLKSSNDIRLVAQALGHSDVRITMRYTERREEEVAKALEKSRKTKKAA